MRYSLALFCPDLKYSSKNCIPVGVLVVDEDAKKYGLKCLSDLSQGDIFARIIWKGFPNHIRQRFDEYCQEPNHDFYERRLSTYHGFISQIVYDWSQSTISFSDSLALERDSEESIEQRTETLFKQKVLSRLD